MDSTALESNKIAEFSNFRANLRTPPWRFLATPWYSTADCGNVLTTRTGGDLRCYLRVGDEVFQTNETNCHGIEAMLPTLQLLNLTAYGRQEKWDNSPG
jgi:hypothetical protein